MQDSRASDSMAEAIELARLNRLTRTAVKLIKGVQILQTEQAFEFAVFSVIGWFKVSPTPSILSALSADVMHGCLQASC